MTSQQISDFVDHGVPLDLYPNLVFVLATTPKGTRYVQEAFKSADRNACLKMAFALKGHIWDLLKCRFGNYALQELIKNARPADLQCVIDELLTAGNGSAVKAARDKYGCRILQRLLEHCPPKQVSAIIESLLAETVSLATHQFGMFSLQHLLEHGPADVKSQIMETLTQNVVTIGTSMCGAAVLHKAMEKNADADPAAQMKLAQTLAMDRELLCKMGCTRHGHPAVKQALELLDPSQRQDPVYFLFGKQETLSKSRYGRLLTAFVQRCASQDLFACVNPSGA